MEPTHDPQPSDPAPWGELVVQNGRLSGTHRALTSPLTLIGQAAGCDVRLNVEGVHPQHCALVIGPTGLLLRDLQGESGTLVNGEPVTSCLLHNGDVLTVGPFSFQVLLPTVSPWPDPDALDQEKEALRIQAAAVAAQQAALTELEMRLQQRRTALEQQEQQLATHLEEKRQRLVALRDEARQAHTVLQKERTAYEERVAAVMQDLAHSRREIAEQQRLALTERRRLFALRHRLKRRWHRQWAGERAMMRRREAEVQEQQRRLEKEKERFQQEKADLSQTRLRFNGEVELTRRQLQADQEQWQQEQQEAHQQSRALEQRTASLMEADQQLAREKRHWDTIRQQCAKEVEGLESRIRNYRRKILDQEKEVQRLETVIQELQSRRLASPQEQQIVEPRTSLTVAPVPVSAEAELEQRAWQLRQAEADLQHRLDTLEGLAGELADQRLYLAEECERLVQAQQSWQQERQTAAGSLEALGQRLHEQEQTLRTREQALELAEYGLRQRTEELGQTQRQLEGWKARLAVAVTNWEGERERLLADLRTREEAVEQRQLRLMDLRERWDKRRRRQVTGLRAHRIAYEELRRECLALRDEYARHSGQFEQQQRTLEERKLALEQSRQEYLGRATDPAAAEKRLEQLRRRWAALSTTTQRALLQERQSLEARANRLEEQTRQLHQQTQELTQQETEFQSRVAAWEHQQLLAEEAQGKQRQELHSLRSQRQRYEQQLDVLRDEVERLARLLLGETVPGPFVVGQAA
jgi:chromosome segregation ATPase